MTATPPKVSVILPTYNRAHLLPRAIASVLGQTFADFELIVVDDGSKDDTVALMRSYADPRIVFLPPDRNLGDAGARNRGIAVARGTWLAFQDSDDEWAPHALATQLALAGSLPHSYAAVASSTLRIVGEQLERIDWPSQRNPAGHLDVDRVRFIAGFTAYLQSLLVRRDALQALNGFDTRLRARSDFDFCLRLVERHNIAVHHELLALSYESADSISKREDYRSSDIRAVLDRHGPLIDRYPRAAARYWWHLARAELLQDHAHESRRAVLQSLRRDPLQPRAWALLALSPLGARGFTTLRALRRGRTSTST